MIIHRTTDATLWDYRDENDRTIASVASAPYEDGVFLFRLWVQPERRRQGLATDLLRDVMLNVSGQNVYLAPAPFLDSPMTLDELGAWYERLGFAWIDEQVMHITQPAEATV